MPKRQVETGILLWADRYMPGHSIMEMARQVEASGVIDWPAIPDQMCNFIPPSLWNAANTPLAGVIPDPDSFMDGTVMMSLAHAAAPSLGLNFLSDTRRPPAELVWMMWTMATVMEGRARFQYGPGEIKNMNPYGHLRKHGLARYEDILKMAKAFWESDGPIDFVGNHTELKRAYLGGAKPHRPQIWTMGTGPKQVEMTLTYADGLSGTIPWAWASPEQTKTEIDAMKRTLVEKGRDPEAFGFGSYFTLICHEDRTVIERALDNALLRWFAGALGRVNPLNWRKEGIEPVTPEGWTYFLSLFPHGATTPEFVQDIVARTTRRMVERSFICGTPAEAAAQIQEYVDAGLTWVCPVDYLAMVLEPADAAKSLGRLIEVCARLKGVKTAAG